MIGFSAGLLGIVPFMVVSESMTIAWSWPLIGSLTYLIIGNSLIGVGLLLAMIRAGDVSRVSALFYLVPPMAATFAWLILDEDMPPVAWLGMLLSAIGVFLATKNRKSPNV